MTHDQTVSYEVRQSNAKQLLSWAQRFVRSPKKPSCDKINLPAEPFILYDILQMIASFHSISITVLLQWFRRTLHFIMRGLEQHTGDSCICPKLYQKQGLKHSSCFTPPAGQWPLWEDTLTKMWLYASSTVNKDLLSVSLSCDSEQQQDKRSLFTFSSLICLQKKLSLLSLLGKLNTYLLPLFYKFNTLDM